MESVLSSLGHAVNAAILFALEALSIYAAFSVCSVVLCVLYLRRCRQGRAGNGLLVGFLGVSVIPATLDLVLVLWAIPKPNAGGAASWVLVLVVGALLMVKILMVVRAVKEPRPRQRRARKARRRERVDPGSLPEVPVGARPRPGGIPGVVVVVVIVSAGLLALLANR
jgi:Na+/proline symporter